MRSSRNPLFIGLLHLFIASALYACSDDENDGGLDSGNTMGSGSGGKGGSGTAGTSSTTAGSSSTGTGGSSSSSGGSGTTAPVEACPGLPFENEGGGSSEGGAGGESGDGACTGVSYEAESVDVDMFIMMDRSSSMAYELDDGSTRWEALRTAVEEFVQSEDAADIGGGIGFFSLSGAAANDALDCSADNYAEPVVGIAPLSESGASLLSAMDDVDPAGLTPTIPALKGAMSYAKSWAEDNPEKATVVVLVTDGYPTQCGNAPEEVSAVAAAGYEEAPHVRTYVIGVGDVARFNLDGYARAGGTREAYLTDDGDVSSTFVTALNNITNSQIACDYTIPTPADTNMQIDFDKVQVVYTPEGDEPEEVPRIDALGDCAKQTNGGWYYNNPEDPSRITVCPCTCARFAAGRVDVRLGCEPRIGLR